MIIPDFNTYVELALKGTEFEVYMVPGDYFHTDMGVYDNETILILLHLGWVRIACLLYFVILNLPDGDKTVLLKENSTIRFFTFKQEAADAAKDHPYGPNGFEVLKLGS